MHARLHISPLLLVWRGTSLLRVLGHSRPELEVSSAVRSYAGLSTAIDINQHSFVNFSQKSDSE